MKKIVVLGVCAGLSFVATAAPRISVEALTKDIGEYKKMAQFAKEIGATHLSACQVEPSLWEWDATGRNDPYPNWSMHRPSLFKFVVPEELKKYIPADYAARNLATLKSRFEILKAYGLKATFIGMEPAYLPEDVYRDHPSWRGPACHHQRRAKNEYYAPCLDNPEFRSVYVKAITELCKAAPFESFSFLVNDSGAGLCWCPHSYPGINGPAACQKISYSDRVVNYLSCFQEGAAAAGLPDVKVNIERYMQRPAVDVDAIIKVLKPGQSIRGCTASGKAASHTVGFPNCFAEHSYPVAYMPRVAKLVEQLQAAQRHKGDDIIYAVKGVDDLDAMILARKYLHKSIGEGPAARAAAIEDVASEIVKGKEAVAKLSDVWLDIESILHVTGVFAQGGHLYLLGGTHQRWLTRPIVPFPEELTAEEKDYWRPFIFQAQTEKEAEYPLDLQAGRWVSGFGAHFITGWLAMEKVRPLFARSISNVKTLIGKGVDKNAEKYLDGLLRRLVFYRDVAEMHALIITYQFHLDDWRKHHGNELLPESSDFFRLQGEGDRLREVNQYNRNMVELSRSMADQLDSAYAAGIELIQCAPSDEFETIMTLPPAKKLAEQMRRKADIMWAHRNDHNRIWRGRNP